MERTHSAHFKARAHILRLLGDQLIGNDRLAVFELVKNAYDADATRATVTLHLEGEKPSITVEDDGCGMTLDLLQKGWLEIGTDAKRGDNRSAWSSRFKRVPLGEKGVGRLAACKLGDRLVLTTRAAGQPEYRMKINWPQLIEKHDYIEKVGVEILQRDEPKRFGDNATGTRIHITKLIRPEWTRGEVRSLKRMLTSLTSPFEAPDSFAVQFNVPDHEDWLEELFEPEDILAQAMWEFSFRITDGTFAWEYRFNPPARFKSLKSRETASVPGERLEMSKDDPLWNRKKVHLDSDYLKGIGPINGQFYVYDRRPKVLNLTGNANQIKGFLNEQTGVRVYRGGIRVYNYGEPDDDWLGLNARRINRPALKMGTNSVIAAVHIRHSETSGLHEKTNREGFDENNCFLRFRSVLQNVVEFLDRTRRQDRESLDQAIKGEVSALTTGPERFEQTVNALRKTMKKHQLEKELGPKIDVIEKEYNSLREVAMSAGAAGMNIAVIFHEVEREVRDLDAAIRNRHSEESIAQHAKHLVKLLEGFAPLLKKNRQRRVKASEILAQVKFLTERRFSLHHITFSCPVLTGEDVDFEVAGADNLYLGAIINLVDNAIHWCKKRRELDSQKRQMAIAIRTLPDWAEEGPCLAVIDTGPGFEIDFEDAVKPFVSTRAGGMGLGLYYTSLVMESQGGAVMLADISELDLPKAYDGAAVILRFRRK
jgi:signal transduction histidine kinase